MKYAELARFEEDPSRLRETFSYFPSGVVALIATVNGEPQGMVASAFTVGVSLDPPLVSCAVQRSSTTWPLLRQAETVGVSVLAHDHGGLARQISSKNRGTRFVDVPLRHTGSSALFIAGAPVWLEVAFHDELAAGDHTVALLEVRGLGADPELQPLVFHGSAFKQLLLPQRDLVESRK
jgi:flavin reductase (DIM6/NTAB) family NADH-FMN oxidoreductase RutF